MHQLSESSEQAWEAVIFYSHLTCGEVTYLTSPSYQVGVSGFKREAAGGSKPRQLCGACRRNATVLRKLLRKALLKRSHDKWGQAMARVAAEECQSFTGHQHDTEDSEPAQELG